ncbi:MAG: 2-hydroxyacid dehydrogenase [Beijerinckiaceae bacterium]
MTLLVAINGWDAEPWAERFRRFMPGRPVIIAGTPVDEDAVRYVATWKHTPHSLTPFKNLTVIFSLGAGVDHLFSDPGLPDVPLVRVVDPDLTARMSEYVVLHCLMHLRQQRLYDAQQRDKLWHDDRFQPAAGEVDVGIMGMGELGQDAARKLLALGFRVNGWSRTARAVEGVNTYAGHSELTDFLGNTDILVALLPLTPDTQGIINAARLRQLRRNGRLGGPYLINAGRGGLQRENDILACIHDGTLKGATLDVFETEPLPPDSPLWTHPAITVTPHNAAMSNPDTIGKQIADQISAFESGHPLQNRVDRQRRY